MIKSARSIHQCKYLFQSVLPDKWNITVLWLFFWLVGRSVILYIFSGTHPGRTRERISTIYGSYDVFSPKDGPFGDCDNIGIHLGVISPKLPKNSPKGRERQFQSDSQIAPCLTFLPFTRELQDVAQNCLKLYVSTTYTNHTNILVSYQNDSTKSRSNIT